MKRPSKDVLIGAAVVAACWNGIGMMIGAIETGENRRGDFNGTTMQYEHQRTGCVYESISSYTNLGYLLVCELGRKRFQREGL